MPESRVISPLGDSGTPGPSLSEGEEELISFLDEELPEGWKIYARPHLNGEWPSVVILHPEQGLIIYDAIKWEEGEMTSVTQPIEVNGQTYSQTRYVPTEAAEGDKDRIKQISPVKQARRYQENLIGIYLPRLGEAVDQTPRYLKESIRVGLYFPNLTTKQARDLIGGTSAECIVFGEDHLVSEALPNLIVPILRSESRFTLKNWAEEIDFLLDPPLHSEKDGRPINLTSKQEKYAKPRPETHRRLKGTAGSGKTLVLAQRAARNAAKGDRVLVVYYNITLGHYIRHLIEKAAYDFAWKNIEILHFHEFCRRYLQENGLEWPQGSDDDQVLTKEVPKAVISGMERGLNAMGREYDVILIDEGQDFDESWFEALHKFLEKPGEVLMVADERQNIYDRIHHYGGMNFSGPFGSLSASYRMPSNLVREVNRFADSFVKESDEEYASGEVEEVQQAELGFDHPTLVWQNVDDFEAASTKAVSAVRHLTADKDVHPEDIVVLVPNHKEGRRASALFEEEGYSVNHVFGKDGSDTYSRRKKKAFVMDDGRLKLSTIHSFKGWEIVNVLILTPGDERSIPPQANLDLLLYTAITRAQNNLFVFNRHPKYRGYGEEWSSSWN
jgi:thymidine kinase